MPVDKKFSAKGRCGSATVTLGGALVLAAAGLLGGTTSAFAQSGELAGVIFLNDVPGFVGQDDADTVVACLPSGECVTGEGNVLTGFRPALWPNLRLVDDDPVIESNVDVQATAFGRILARDGFMVESFASGPGHPIDSVDDDPSEAAAVAITPHSAWAPNNFEGSGAVWISYTDTGITGPAAAPIGTTFTVRESFTIPLGTTGAVDGFVFADDTAEVVLIQDGQAVVPPVFDFNFTQQTCANGPIGCEVTDKGDLSLGDSAWQAAGPPLDLNALEPGDYTLEFTALQNSAGTVPANNPFGLMYAFDVTLDPETVAEVCWTFDGGIPGEKVCVSIADCADCGPPPVQCPVGGDAITLIAGAAGDAICDDLATQFFEDGVTEVLEEFQFVVGFDVPETSQPGSVRIATCTIDDTGVTYVPVCRNPASKVVNSTVTNDIPLSAVETPRCVKISGKTYC